ncbi:MAG: peptide chain release factor N(5)-glutamine methyltransferase [Chlorobi bacterium]|nr:peptide chain release factor N(5)-glutamine methyltransferase [Chlorobiota bacterium]
MLTVLESINLSTDYLEKKGIDSARTNAELLLASILKCKRLDLYMSFNRPLSDAEKIKYREYISRRGTFEPLQYIVGDVEFYGITLKVNKSVLIPRQETEILIEEIINAVNHEDEIKILDIGSGSGNIALALAKNLPNAEVIGIDVSEEAVELAKRNAELTDLSTQVKFSKLDIFDFDISEAKDKFDIIVSNPPYVSDEEYQTLQKEIIEYEPSLAVTDSADGFKFYEHITNISKTLLKDGGKLFYEIGKGQAEKVISILEQNGFSDIKVKKDYAEIERVVSGVRQ